MTGAQQLVQETVDELVESGAERGVQVAVYHHGEQIVDVVAGVADPGSGRTVASGTPFYNFSIGKGATATVAHVLAEQGVFGYDTPVVDLWPEFGAHGKHSVTIRHVLTHTAGVPAVPPETTAADLCDWDAMCGAIADARPWWPPGARVGYHSWTFGYLVGEVARRATGKPIAQVLRDEVTGPLGVADELYFGVPPSEHHRLARLEDAQSMPAIPADSPMRTVVPSAVLPGAGMGNRPDILAATIPSAATTSARAIARMYAAVLGEVDGARLIPQRRLDQATALAASGMDEIFGNPAVWGLGYAIGRLGTTPDKSPTVFGMAGAGGSYAYADTATGVAVALTKNRFSADFTTATRISQLITDVIASS
jgi:CubicO group peptidase (beta-lactamase class C family)